MIQPQVGAKFQTAVGRMVDIAKTVTPEEIERTRAILAEKVKPKRKGKAKRKAAEGSEAPPAPKSAAKDAA